MTSYVSLRPVVVIFIVAGFLGIIAVMFLIPLIFGKKSPVLKLSLGVLCIFCLLPSLIDLDAFFPDILDGRYRVFKRTYRDIHEGMNRSEIKDVIKTQYPVSGERLKPKIIEDTSVSLVMLMDPEGSREPNCEGILLTFKNDELVKKQYSRD
jgi:hypothetical protein